MNKDHNKKRAVDAIKQFGRTFYVAAEVLKYLCEIEPREAGNYSMRFETNPPQFVFSNSAEQLYYYRIPAADLLDITAISMGVWPYLATQTEISSFARKLSQKLQVGWETLKQESRK